MKSKVGKVIKAVVTGGLMLGATMAGAMAYTVNDYPTPFIKDGKFSGVLVVGDKAAAEDVIGISDILANLQYSAVNKFSAVTSGNIETEGDVYKIGGSKKLALSEYLTPPVGAAMTIRNVSISLIGGTGGELKALESNSVHNNKGIAPYNQYLNLLDPGTGGLSGFVVYTENNQAKTGDYLFFRSGESIGKYVLEFTTALQSDVDDSSGSSSTTGTFLTDMQNTDIKMFGKDYTIVTARRLTTAGSNIVLTLMGGAIHDTLDEKQTKVYTVKGVDYEVTLSYVDTTSAQLVVNGQTTRKMNKGDTDRLSDGTNVGVSEILFQNFAGGIHSASFFIGAQKLELKDNNITDSVSSNTIKVDDSSITSANVVIEGTDDSSTLKINRISVNMTADDTYYVPAGGMLSQNPDLRKSGVLFTQNWDIKYAGLRNVLTERIALTSSSDNQYQLEFVDAGGLLAKVPIARATGGTALIMGDNDKPFVVDESKNVTKDTYFIVTDGTQQRGLRKTYALQYKGADRSTADSPVLRFMDIGSGNIIEQSYTTGQSPIAQLKLGGTSFGVYNSSVTSVNDFNIRVDMDGVGGDPIITGSNNITITTKNGAEIAVVGNMAAPIPFETVNVHTPDSSIDANAIDSIDQTTATNFLVNITADNSRVTHVMITPPGGRQLNLKAPSGTSNVAYGYTSYGAFIERNTPSSNPATFRIDYPQSQRDALVYILGKGATVTTPSIISQGDAVIVQRIDVGAAKLASEVSNVKSQNVILVGGPCANGATAAVTGLTCDTWPLANGEAFVRYYDNSGNVAMLVAGTTKEDTRNAVKALLLHKLITTTDVKVYTSDKPAKATA